MFHKSLIACLFAARAVAVLQLAEKGFSQQARPVSDSPTPAILRNYQLVTAERLKNPEANNWLMIRRTYDGWGYSPLAQITATNVTRLRPVWVFSTGETRVHEEIGRAHV